MAHEDNVLYLQHRHISNNINAENMDAIVPPRRSDKCLWRLYNVGLHHRVRLCLAHMGFYGILQYGPIKNFDNHLLTAMVERWRQETHTFHLPVGEATITLQDVALIWGLNIDGRPITGVDTAFKKHELQERCVVWLGFMPTPSQIKGGHLYLSTLCDHCIQHQIDEDSTDVDVAQYSRCVALLIIGGCMFPDSEGAAVKLLYLQFLEDIDRVHTYSWGSAVLAYLYRELCNVAMGEKAELCGPIQIIQIWTWSRITLICPDRLRLCSMAPEHNADNLQDLPCPPYGARWRRGFSWTHTVRHSVRIARDMLDRMVEGQFNWRVYDMESPEVTRLPDGCRNALCRSACPLINFDIVEMHRPERVLRQFGMRQSIPPPIIDCFDIHRLTRQGRRNFDWMAFHQNFVDSWTNRYHLVVVGDTVVAGTPDTTRQYMGWYRRISRIFLSPANVPANTLGYHPVDAHYRQFWDSQYQPRASEHIPQPRHDHMQYPTWTNPQLPIDLNVGPSSTSYGMTHHEDEPGPSSANAVFSTPVQNPPFQSYDHGYYTPYVGSFTALLQSDFQTVTNELRPHFNQSPIPFPEYSQTPGNEMPPSTVGTSTATTMPQTEEDDGERLGRGHRQIVRPWCDTAGYRYHYYR